MRRILLLGLVLLGACRTQPDAPLTMAPIAPAATAAPFDAASRRAIERIYPRGDGTPWCLIERVCSDALPTQDPTATHFDVFRFAMTIDNKERPALCLDIMPCAEVVTGGAP